MCFVVVVVSFVVSLLLFFVVVVWFSLLNLFLSVLFVHLFVSLLFFSKPSSRTHALVSHCPDASKQTLSIVSRSRARH